MRKPLRIAIPALVLAVAGAAAFFTLDLQAKLGLGPEDDTTLVLYGNVDIRQVELGFRRGRGRCRGCECREARGGDATSRD